MPLGVWQNTIRDSSGKIAPGAQLTVLDSTTQSPRDLFADRDSVTALDNPFTADEFGFARFYSDNGRVHIQIVAGGRTALLENVMLIDDFPA